ncbi:hypothetical protein SAMD00019534_057310 [Acytostelium subglobosum LB1]|uniref:hypothetical protein n=1 Tax=Acytostelium subglobosum LB1 TaxID=1410327 RepID=UPI000644BEFC|nr:hypothetical protein SAMD00019534_057310 [Acytostelium subglobosum LB1]GAM22556.1 hypothetical protein SAMD00019534_057310 [Acytostelium subglobosum LB1]|eukprot:XP_012754676.1 hypothetical protein SAMD00019534_057310 [Acytostelium subglobosum LB1]
MFRKAGFIQEIEEGVPRIHFLADEATGERIGKAVICFARKESLPLAIQLFDGVEMVKGYPITLSQAQGEEIVTKTDPALAVKKSRRSTREDKKKEADYGWGEAETRVVVIKNLFDPVESWTNPNFFEELKEDIEAGCERCGEIQSITIFERNPEGVATIKFKDFESAERCVALMEGRYFAQRQLHADYYDGYSDYHVEETEEEREMRLKVWEKYLEDEDNKKDTDDDNSDDDQFVDDEDVGPSTTVASKEND